MELGNGIFLDKGFTNRFFNLLDELIVEFNSPVYLVVFTIISDNNNTPLTLDNSTSIFIMLLNEICKENIVLTNLFLGMEDISGIKHDTFMSIKDKIIFEKSVAYRGLKFLMNSCKDGIVNVPPVIFTNTFSLLEKCFIFHEACSEGEIDMVKWFVDCGLDTNIKDSIGNTGIHKAAEKGRQLIVEFLCENEPLSINFMNNRLYTPLHTAVSNKHLSLATLLIGKGSSLTATTSENDTPLHLAAHVNFYEIVSHILTNNATAVNLCETKNSKGFCPIHIAASKSHWNLLKLLIPHTKNIDDITTHCLNTAMHFAVKHIIGEGVNCLLAAGSKPDIKNSKGLSPLHIAAIHGHISHVTNLINKNHSINIQSNDGNTPLHYAALHGHTMCFTTLLCNGADLKAENSKGETIMSKMIENGSSAMQKLLFETFPAINNTNLLIYAAKDGHKNCVENLIEKVQNCRPRLHVSGETPIHLASKNGHIAILTLLLNKGEDINSICYDGSTALHKAVKSQNLSCVKFLLENGADVNSASFNGMSPLHYSLEGDNEDIVTLLVGNGANLNARMSGGLTFVHKAVLQGNNKLLKIILKLDGINVNAKENSGMTPLHLTIRERNLTAAQLLLEAGANYDMKTNSGLTPLLIAVELGSKELIELLIRFGADVNLNNKKKMSPLHLAILNRHTSIIELLLSTEVWLYEPDMFGRSHLDLLRIFKLEHFLPEDYVWGDGSA